MPSDVFISYSRKDWALVEPFYDGLTALGYDIWIDKDGIESGDAFKKTILRAIKSSRCVVFFSSCNSNVSEWTAKEIGVAVKSQIPIIPVRFDDSDYNEDVQFDLINLDFTDYSKPEERERQMSRFLRSIRKKLGEKVKPVESVPAPVPLQAGISPGCELHFGTDMPCDIYQFKILVGHIEPDGDFSLVLRPGKYKFEFVDAAASSHRYSVVHVVEDIASDYIDIELRVNGIPNAKSVSVTESVQGATSAKKTASSRTVTSSLSESRASVKADSDIVLSQGQSSVLLESVGWSNRDKVMGILQRVLGYEKAYAKSLVKLAPVHVASGLSASAAKQLCDALKEAGAEATVRSLNRASSVDISPEKKYMILLENPGWNRLLVTKILEKETLVKEYVNLCPVNIGIFNSETAKRLYDSLTNAGAKVSLKEQ